MSHPYPTTTSDALGHVDSLMQRPPQVTPAGDPISPVRKIRSLGIVGAGLMGTAIAAAAVRRGLQVAITDSNPDVLASAPARIAEELASRPVAPAQASGRAIMGLVEPTLDPARWARCDVVLESVVENVSVKQATYAGLELLLARGAILASNTSTIPIARLASRLADPGRFCGIHFFHPVRRRQLVEIVRGPASTGDTLAVAVRLARAMDKSPIVVEDGPGFLVNRLLMPYLTEALELLLDGATIDHVEQAATAFGMAMGPLRLLDEIGLDTVFHGGRVLWEAFPERIVASPLMVAMVKAKRLGRKAGAGFFRYPHGLDRDQPGLPDAEVERIIAEWSRPPQSFSEEAIVHRLILPMVLEATRVLAEGVVRDPRDVDRGLLLGLGFPAVRGGLLHWADSLGLPRLVGLLHPFESLGPRFQPTPYLSDLAQRAGRFYQRAS